MAERRMFAKTIIDSDAFLDMPLSTQALYFHLSMRADDDGFVNSPKKISRLLGCGDDDARLLLAKKFIISFESGVIVIKHWKIHNYIQKDRYNKTNYHEEMGLLSIDKNNGYTLDTECIQNGDTGKVREELGKGRKEKINKKELITNFLQSSNLQYINKNSLTEWLEYKKWNYEIVGVKKILSLLEKFNFETQSKMIDNSIMNGYKGLFEIKQQVNNTNKTRNAIDEVLKQRYGKKDTEIIISDVIEIGDSNELF